METTFIQRPLILYHCGHEQCQPSHFFGPAIRPHYLIHFVLHGQGIYYVNGSTYHITGGNGFLIHPGVTTLYCADDNDPWEYCWIGFDGYDVETVLHKCGLSMTNLVFSDQSSGSLWKDMLDLIYLFTERKGNEFTYLGQLYRCFSDMYLPLQAITSPVPVTFIEKALDYIHNNYTYEITIADIAKYLSIDRTYLYKLFMTHVKVSPQQYLIHYRLDVSQKLLRETHLSITEISYSCGFRDASSFNKHFKKHFHNTPLKYRAENGA
jgi:AraC-type DNA-binding domain-containing proteins